MWCMVRVSLCYECSFPLVEMCRRVYVQTGLFKLNTIRPALNNAVLLRVSAGVVVVVVVKVQT